MKQAASSSQCVVGGPARRTSLCVEARHPSKAHHHRGVHPHSKRSTNKKRDISTSFRRGPVPRPLTNHTGGTQQQHDEEEQPMIMLGMPPPAAPGGFAGGASPTAAATASLAGLNNNTDLFYTTTRPAATEPVVAAAAAAAAFTMPAQDLGLSLDPAGVSSDDELGAWADADPLAAFDRVLDSLLVSPALPPSFGGNNPKPASSRKRSSSSTSSTSSSASLNLSSLLDELPVAAVAASSTTTTQQQSASSSSSSKSKSSSSSKAGRSYAQSLAAAAAAPAVTVIHCENEYERELEAAAALQQLLVVKVESSHQLLHGAYDSTLRFQTHTGLPTQLNAYLPHNDISQGFGYVNGSSHSGSGLGATNGGSASSNTADVLASMGVTLGAPAFTGSSTNSSGVGHMGSAAAGSSLFPSSANSSSSGEPFSPVHAWYKQLAAQYAHSAAAAGRSSSPFRFLSLRGDAARARAVCRRLGVSAPLAVVLVDPAAGGRRLQEVVGAKIEQELPNGLLYFGGSDPSGIRPADQLVQINTEAELEAVKSAAPVSVVAFHVHAAPPCVRSYGRMHAVAQQQHAACAAGGVSFGVMDVDVAAEGGAVSTQLNLQQLPTYIIYSNGQEVARLSSSPDRRRLGEVLAQQLSGAAAGQQQQ